LLLASWRSSIRSENSSLSVGRAFAAASAAAAASAFFYLTYKGRVLPPALQTIGTIPTTFRAVT